MSTNERVQGTTPGMAPPESSSDQGVGSLVSGLIADLQSLVRSEVKLAKTELKEDATQMGAGAGMIAGGALVGLVGFIFLMLAVMYLLNKAMQLWIAAGIVGVVLAVIAGIVVMSGKSKLSAANLKPQETIDSLKESKQWASNQMQSVKK